MNFSAFSIRNPIPAVLLFILLTLAGIISFQKSEVQDFPDIELPVVTVDASLPGAAPAQLETEVSRKLENSVATLQGVKHIYSRILDGQVTLNVEFVLEKDPSDAVNEVRDAIGRVRADLPSDMRDPAVSKASIAPSVSSGQSAKLMFALLTISMQIAAIDFGMACPPNASGCWSPCQPPAIYLR